MVDANQVFGTILVTYASRRNDEQVSQMNEFERRRT